MQSKRTMIRRIQFEIARATTPETIARLRETLSQVEQHLIATQRDADEEEWCDLLVQYTTGMKVVMAKDGESVAQSQQAELFAVEPAPEVRRYE